MYFNCLFINKFFLLSLVYICVSLAGKQFFHSSFPRAATSNFSFTENPKLPASDLEPEFVFVHLRLDGMLLIFFRLSPPATA